jgi:hypothetical protein
LSRRTQRGLDLAQLVAERRLAQVQAVSGAGQAAVVDDGEQHAQVSGVQRRRRAGG